MIFFYRSSWKRFTIVNFNDLHFYKYRILRQKYRLNCWRPAPTQYPLNSQFKTKSRGIQFWPAPAKLQAPTEVSTFVYRSLSSSLSGCHRPLQPTCVDLRYVPDRIFCWAQTSGRRPIALARWAGIAVIIMITNNIVTPSGYIYSMSMVRVMGHKIFFAEYGLHIWKQCVSFGVLKHI